MSEITVGSADKRTFTIYVILLLFCAGVVRLLLAEQYSGFISDQGLFVQWMESVRENGLGGAFAVNGSINYPPLFLGMLGLYGDLLHLLGISTQAGAVSFKFILIMIDLVAILLVVRLTAGIANYNWRAFVILLFALNPALMTDSAVWGQVDLLHSILMLLAVIGLTNRPLWSGILFAFALLTKFQAITVLPVMGLWLLLILIREKQYRPLLLWVSGFAGPWILTIIYFGATGSLTKMIRQAYTDAVGFYSSASMNAMNIWFHIIGVDPGTNDTQTIAAGISMRNFGFLLLFAAVIGICLYMYYSREDRTTMLLKASATLCFSFFMLPTEIHERYSIPALVFTLLVIKHDKQWTWSAGLLTLTILMNLVIVLNNDVTAGNGIWMAIVNVLVLIGMFGSLWMGVKRSCKPSVVKEVGER
ncbi:hypothetical protein Back11_20890 [Paenibacillus baekrokdamisoli]|uniref:Uncharacterized protein n=1 Tax=Paenibacillus baekrokdamisoli TaxID=1712516 RepID=A0A3G9JBT4_9BACL|nr:hypothetical protein [Paenibacillus baekrokdamisoli]MBB3069903.1 Gpi18-like mannosyltransferase [Paenibacillus baekrokdamisoli]BBH20744.1 hypothetical protein Back11_20890 [Paenibacillus baekrokdamisoli]